MTDLLHTRFSRFTNYTGHVRIEGQISVLTYWETWICLLMRTRPMPPTTDQPPTFSLLLFGIFGVLSENADDELRRSGGEERRKSLQQTQPQMLMPQRRKMNVFGRSKHLDLRQNVGEQSRDEDRPRVTETEGKM